MEGRARGARLLPAQGDGAVHTQNHSSPGYRWEVWKCPLARRCAGVPVSLPSRVASCPPSWLAQEMHLAPCFPCSVGSSAPGRPSSGQCAAHAVMLRLPFPRRTGLPFVTDERRGDEKLGGACQGWREPSAGGEGGWGGLVDKGPSCLHTCGAAGALTGGITPLTEARRWQIAARCFK